MSGAVKGGVGEAGGGKAFGTQAAGIADAAGTAEFIGLVAGNGQAVIDAQRLPVRMISALDRSIKRRVDGQL
jgi:hypothetical protein